MRTNILILCMYYVFSFIVMYRIHDNSTWKRTIRLALCCWIEFPMIISVLISKFKYLTDFIEEALEDALEDYSNEINNKSKD